MTKLSPVRMWFAAGKVSFGMPELASWSRSRRLIFEITVKASESLHGKTFAIVRDREVRYRSSRDSLSLFAGTKVEKHLQFDRTRTRIL